MKKFLIVVIAFIFCSLAFSDSKYPDFKKDQSLVAGDSNSQDFNCNKTVGFWAHSSKAAVETCKINLEILRTLEEIANKLD